MALIEDAPRTATVIARSKCVFAEITPERFKSMVSQMPSLALEVMKTMSRRLRTDVKSNPVTGWL